MMIRWEHLTEDLEEDSEEAEAEEGLLSEAAEGSEVIVGNISTGVGEAIEAIVEIILIEVVEAKEETVSIEAEEAIMEVALETECIL